MTAIVILIPSHQIYLYFLSTTGTWAAWETARPSQSPVKYKYFPARGTTVSDANTSLLVNRIVGNSLVKGFSCCFLIG